jgi:hypothetical protein
VPEHVQHCPSIQKKKVCEESEEYYTDPRESDSPESTTTTFWGLDSSIPRKATFGNFYGLVGFRDRMLAVGSLLHEVVRTKESLTSALCRFIKSSQILKKKKKEKRWNVVPVSDVILLTNKRRIIFRERTSVCGTTCHHELDANSKKTSESSF